MVHDTPPYGHAPTHQISLTYLERQKCYAPDKKILFNFFIWPWGQRSRSYEGHYGTPHTALCSCTHIPKSLAYLERQKSYGPDKLRWEEAEAEEKIRLKQYVSFVQRGDIITTYFPINKDNRDLLFLWHMILLTTSCKHNIKSKKKKKKIHNYHKSDFPIANALLLQK
jgi:hypothetical protein